MSCGNRITQLAQDLGIQTGVYVFEDVSKDFKGAGSFVKLTSLKAGDHVIKHKHNYDHLSILLNGRVEVETDDYMKVIDATKEAQSIIIKSNKYHSVKALTDATWLCVHATEEVK